MKARISTMAVLAILNTPMAHADSVDIANNIINTMKLKTPTLTAKNVTPSVRMISGTVYSQRVIDKAFSQLTGQLYYVDMLNTTVPIDISHMIELPKSVTISIRSNEKRSRAYGKEKKDPSVGDFRLGSINVSFGFSAQPDLSIDREDVPLVENDTNMIPPRASDRDSPFTDFQVRTGTTPFKGIADAYSSFMGWQAEVTDMVVGTRDGEVRANVYYRDVVNSPALYSAKGFLRALNNGLTRKNLIKPPYRYSKLYVHFSSEPQSIKDDEKETAWSCSAFEKHKLPTHYSWFHIPKPFDLTEVSYDFVKKAIPDQCKKQLLEVYPVTYTIWLS